MCGIAGLVLVSDAHPEDSPFRRAHRRWAPILLARTVARHGEVH